MLDKIAVLSLVPGAGGLELWETLGYTQDGGFAHLDDHLGRMATSARFFGLDWDEAIARSVLIAAIGARRRARVRLALGEDGRFAVDVAEWPADRGDVVILAVDASHPVSPESIWQQHKTNRRATYDEARSRHPAADDVVLVNDRGDIVETTIASLLVCVDGAWYTPALVSGCLPGIGRGHELAHSSVTERILTPADLQPLGGDRGCEFPAGKTPGRAASLARDVRARPFTAVRAGAA